MGEVQEGEQNDAPPPFLDLHVYFLNDASLVFTKVYAWCNTDLQTLVLKLPGETDEEALVCTFPLTSILYYTEQLHKEAVIG